MVGSVSQPKPLNVKLVSPDTYAIHSLKIIPQYVKAEYRYPTIYQLVMDMQQKRDATERLIKAKVLQLSLRHIKSTLDMLQESLHFRLAPILAAFGEALGPIKEQVAVSLLKKK